MTKRNLGKSFERLIEAANRQYLITGMAAIEKQEIATKLINGKMIYSKQGPPDFMGIVRGGRGIAFDAKSTTGKSLPLKNLLDRRHQLEFLRLFEKLGGHAFYLVEFAAVNRVFMLPIGQALQAVKEAETGGRKSIPISDFEFEALPSFHCALDYLALLESGEKAAAK